MSHSKTFNKTSTDPFFAKWCRDPGMTTKYGQCKVNICKHIDKGKGNRLSVRSCGFIKSGVCCILRKETANQIKKGSLLIQGASDYDKDRGLVRFI